MALHIKDVPIRVIAISYLQSSKVQIPLSKKENKDSYRLTILDKNFNFITSQDIYFSYNQRGYLIIDNHLYEFNKNGGEVFIQKAVTK